MLKRGDYDTTAQINILRIKPNKEFFDLARENDNYDECVMIGDSLSSDINPAKALGMKTIYISKDNENTDSTINDIRKLKDILQEEIL